MRYVRVRDLMEAPIADELVALDTGDNQCYGFNATARAIWEALAEPRSIDSLVAGLGASFELDDTAADEVDEAVKTFVRLGLVAPADGDGDA